MKTAVVNIDSLISDLNAKTPNTSRYYAYLQELFSSWKQVINSCIMKKSSQEESSHNSSFNVNGIAVPSTYLYDLWEAPYNTCDLNRERNSLYEYRHLAAQNYSDNEIAEFPLETAVRNLKLNTTERELLILLCAYELDSRFEKVYAFLNDNVNRPFLTLNSAAEVLDALNNSASSLDELIKSSLFTKGIVTLSDEENEKTTPFIHKKISIRNVAKEFLLSGTFTSNVLTQLFALRKKEELSPLFGHSEEIHNIAGYFATLDKSQSFGSTIVDIRNISQTQGEKQVEALVRCADLNLICVNTSNFMLNEGKAADHLKTITLSAELTGSAVYFPSFEQINAHNIICKEFIQGIEKSGLLYCINSMSEQNFALSTLSLSYFRINNPEISYSELFSIWDKELKNHGFSDKTISELSARHRFTPEQIKSIVTKYCNSLVITSATSDEEKRNLLFKACSHVTLEDMGSIAQKITPRYNWNDIVLAPFQKQQLQEIVNMVQHRETVFGSWGYGDHLWKSVGVKALFYGDPGTGKTMAVDVIGKELGLDVYRIDLSQIVSKYVGETEKNLDKVFREASKTDAILFFDEADAIFGKRTEVKDSQDRHANIETGYLLQKVEDYNGLVILATNLKNNLDKAFIRRFQFIIKFVMPTERERQQLWKQAFPSKVPLASDIHFDFLSKGLDISGANIKNIAINAAFLAANDASGAIEMRHIVQSVRKEYAKIGKMLTRSELGAYYTMGIQ